MLSIDTYRKISFVNSVAPHLTIREMGKKAGCSHQSVMRHLKRQLALKLSHSEIDKLDDSKLRTLLFKSKQKEARRYREPNYEYIAAELAKKSKYGKTRLVLYFEYREIDPDSAYSKSQFYEQVRRYLKKQKAAMKQVYAVGESLHIDFAGMQLFYHSKGQKQFVFVFVACLAYSKKMFAFATPALKSRDWIMGLENALRYFGGVTEVVHFDNASPMVKKAGLIATLTDNIDAFSRYYNCLCNTSRPGQPKDNAIAESAVKFVTNNIIVPMRGLNFFGLEELNKHLATEVEKLNDKAFQGKDFSRNDLFRDVEKKELKELPQRPFEYLVKVFRRKVPSTYLIPYGEHEYSVPHTLINDTVTVKVTDAFITMFFKNVEVAKHKLKGDSNQFGFTRLREHMPPEHKAESIKTKEHYITWAEGIDDSVVEWVEQQYMRVKSTHSRFAAKSCAALQKLHKIVEREDFTCAIHYALSRKLYTATDMSLIIRVKPWSKAAAKITNKDVAHQNIRGSDYFSGGRKNA